ncbi:MAG: hypothetical protein AVDCRST_MAG56-5191 [uncultured Cytophagales bacterium]|uniref:Glycosyltransferase RgtA/B/C/D-like domain-containing protein n=1 Tax=uncultured Cytophagales bacterium TaxID=158755 RepID=A0A6J4K822_9SPHI|nr:MAG: hypothetical protein AVDCRST_MAG56-5191 [uncultured Cytophagales bacterium]
MKLLTKVTLFIVVVFAIYTRYMAVHVGLPYIHHWDEPFISTSALNIIKTGDINPKYSEICYGGFLRYSCVAIDYVHYLLLKIDPKNGLNDPAQIKTSLEGDFRLVSHPSFYLWNRLFVAAMSIAGFVVVFWIGKLYKDPLTGLVAALLLSGCYYYFDHALYATVDIPMCVWVLVTLWMALRFHRNKQFRFLALSLAGSGMALATKLSGGLALIIPFTAFLLNLRRLLDYKPRVIALLLLSWAVLPFAVLLAWNPNVITDTENYLAWNKWIIEVYKTGGGHFSKEPGWEHLSFQLTTIRDTLTSPVFWLAPVGLFLSCIRVEHAASRRRLAFHANAATLIVFIFPVVYLTYMTQQRVAYHRNFIVMYPFFSLAAAYVVSHVVDTALALFAKQPKNWQPTAGSAFVLLAVVTFQWNHYRHIEFEAYKLYHVKESRTQALDRVKQLVANEGGKGIVGIAKELKVSEADLLNLGLPYRLFAHKDLETARAQSTFLVVGRYRSLNTALHAQDDSLNRLSHSVVQTISGTTIYRDNSLEASQTPHINPQVDILRGASYQIASKQPAQVYESSAGIVMARNAKIFMRRFQFIKGKYTVRIKASGTPMAGIYPHLRVMLGSQELASYYLVPGNQEKRINFSIRNALLDRAVYIEYDNDAVSATEDRNAYIENISVIQYL